MKTSFTGILKLSLDTNMISKLNFLQEQIVDENPDFKPLPNDKLHITLIHQSIFKGVNSKGEKLGKALSNLIKEGKLPEPTFNIELEDDIQFANQGEKQSFYVNVKNQSTIKEYVKQIMSLIGGNQDPEPQRVFHISLCNKTGSPFDSVAKVWEGKFIKSFGNFK